MTVPGAPREATGSRRTEPRVADFSIDGTSNDFFFCDCECARPQGLPRYEPTGREAAMSQSDLWSVQLPGGGVHEVTLDQLDDAFQRGYIDARTWVFVPGNLRWMTLGAILEEPAPVRPPVSRDHESPYSVRPTTIDFEDEPVDLDRFKRKTGRRVISLLAVAGAVWVAAVVRPDLRASATAHVESRWGALHAGQALKAVESRLGRLRAWQALKATVVRAAPAAASPVDPVQAPAIAAPPPPSPAASPPMPGAPAVQIPSATPAAVRAVPQAGELPSATPAVAATPVIDHRRPSPSGPVQPTKARQKASPSHAPRSEGGPRPTPMRGSPFTTGGNKYDPLNSDI
jgi:hypothetical protein